MTLCVAWVRDIPNVGPQLVLATDSRITGGLKYDHGAKLSVFNRRDCAICWHGATTFAYSFIGNARNDIDFSDALSTRATGIGAVAKRLIDVFNHLWQANLDDAESMFHDDEIGFIFGGYDYQLHEVQAWLMEQDPANKRLLTLRKIAPEGLVRGVFVGSGAGAAVALVPKARDHFDVLIKVIDDEAVHDVGGMPQVVTVDRRGSEAIGIEKDGRRYLFGKLVNSSGHWTQTRYIDYAGAQL